jgi:hypothetical protein
MPTLQSASISCVEHRAAEHPEINIFNLHRDWRIRVLPDVPIYGQIFTVCEKNEKHHAVTRHCRKVSCAVCGFQTTGIFRLSYQHFVIQRRRVR